MPLSPQSLAAGAKFVGLGFGLAAAVVAAIWLGDWVDQRAGTSPLFLLLFLAGALIGSIRRMMWMLEARRSDDG